MSPRGSTSKKTVRKSPLTESVGVQKKSDGCEVGEHGGPASSTSSNQLKSSKQQKINFYCCQCRKGFIYAETYSIHMQSHGEVPKIDGKRLATASVFENCPSSISSKNEIPCKKLKANESAKEESSSKVSSIYSETLENSVICEDKPAPFLSRLDWMRERTVMQSVIIGYQRETTSLKRQKNQLEIQLQTALDKIAKSKECNNNSIGEQMIGTTPIGELLKSEASLKSSLKEAELEIQQLKEALLQKGTDLSRNLVQKDQVIAIPENAKKIWERTSEEGVRQSQQMDLELQRPDNHSPSSFLGTNVYNEWKTISQTCVPLFHRVRVKQQEEAVTKRSKLLAGVLKDYALNKTESETLANQCQRRASLMVRDMVTCWKAVDKKKKKNKKKRKRKTD